MDTLQPGLQLSQNLGLQVLPRLKVMYKYIYEMAEAFGASNNCLDSIHRGVFEKKIINKITLRYLVDGDQENEMKELGKVVIAIDWEKHNLLASTNFGKTFTIDTKRSIHSQISEVTDEIIKHTVAFRKNAKIKEVRSFFEYIPEIESNPLLNKEAMSFLGHSYSHTKYVKELDPEFAHTIELITAELSEISIIVSTADN